METFTKIFYHKNNDTLGNLEKVSLLYADTVQDDLLARVVFGKFVCGKLHVIGEFYIGDFVPRAIKHAQIETKWRILYWHRSANRQY